VIFARHLSSVEAVAERLRKDGRRVLTLTVKDSGKEKDAKRRAFKKGEADVLICSDAGAVGANLQTGKWLPQYDTPNTAMLWNQRNGRIFRTGQTSDVELADLVPDTAGGQRDRDRLATKGELRSIMTSPMDGLDDTGLAGVLHRICAGDAEAAGEDYALVPEDQAAAEPEPEE
jgi:superfamily II DNA/RNA helicase